MAPPAVLGEADAKQIGAALRRVSTACWRASTAWAAKADAQVLGPQGLVNESKAGVAQLNALLGDARQT